MKRLINSNNGLYAISIMLSLYYIVIAYLVFSSGIYSNEGLFFSEKAILFANGGVDKLTLVGLTFPQLSFLATWLFSIFDVTFAPFITSAVGTAFLFYVIANSIRTNEYRNWLLVGVLITFLAHPAIIFIAISGKSDYMTLLFFYLFVSAFYRYFKFNTSYHISVASIYFTLLIFCNFKFIWLALFILPVIFVAALQSMQIAKKDGLERIAFAFNSLSIRRKLGNKTIAVYLIVFALPLTALYAFRVLNEIYTGDASYFLDSPYANYLSIVNLTENFRGFNNTIAKSFIPEVSFLTTIRILIYAPTILLCLAIFKSNMRNTFIVFALFLFMEFLKIKYPDVIIQAVFYVAFICICWSIILNASSFRNTKYVGQFYFAIIIFQIFTGYLMMNSSLIPEEAKYMIAFKELISLKKPAQSDRDDVLMVEYINQISASNRILVDDATGYRIIAISGSSRKFIVPAQKIFLAALESPTENVEYILSPSLINPNQYFNLLNSAALSKLQSSGVNLKKYRQTKNWVLYKIYK